MCVSTHAAIIQTWKRSCEAIGVPQGGTAGPILEGHMHQKEWILQAAGKDVHLSLNTVQKGSCSWLTQGMGHLEKELRISGSASCGVQIV